MYSLALVGVLEQTTDSLPCESSFASRSWKYKVKPWYNPGHRGRRAWHFQIMGSVGDMSEDQVREESGKGHTVMILENFLLS